MLGAPGSRPRKFACVSDNQGSGGAKAIPPETTCLKLLFRPGPARRGRAFLSRDAVRCLTHFTCAALAPARPMSRASKWVRKSCRPCGNSRSPRWSEISFQRREDIKKAITGPMCVPAPVWKNVLLTGYRIAFSHGLHDLCTINPASLPAGGVLTCKDKCYFGDGPAAPPPPAPPPPVPVPPPAPLGRVVPPAPVPPAPPPPVSPARANVGAFCRSCFDMRIMI